MLPNSVVLFTAGAVAGALGMPCFPGLHLHLSQHVQRSSLMALHTPTSYKSSMGAPRGHNDLIPDCPHQDAARLDQAGSVSCDIF